MKTLGSPFGEEQNPDELKRCTCKNPISCKSPIFLQRLPPLVHGGCLTEEEMMCPKLLAALLRQRGQVDVTAGSSPWRSPGQVLTEKWARLCSELLLGKICQAWTQLELVERTCKSQVNHQNYVLWTWPFSVYVLPKLHDHFFSTVSIWIQSLEALNFLIL